MRTRPYKHKLNLLEPGAALCKAIGLAGLAGIVLYIVGWKLPSYIAFGIAALITLVLIVLLCIEQHQDKVMLELAKQEDARRDQARM